MSNGGLWDKLGNYYEWQWTLSCFLMVLGGTEATAITIEKFGEDGFEFELVTPQDSEWHQCKRRSDGGNWTIQRLITEGVVAAFGDKLKASQSAAVILITTSSCTPLAGLIDKSKTFSPTSDLLAALNAEEREAFKRLKGEWHCSTDDNCHQMLKRCKIEITSPSTIQQSNRAIARTYFSGDVDKLLPLFWDYAMNRLTQTISTDQLRIDVIQHLNLQLKNWAIDPTIDTRINAANQRYLKSHDAQMHRHPPIVRPEYEAAWQALGLNSRESRILLITGHAGCGKSHVLKYLVNQCQQMGHPVLALRMDAFLDARSIEDIGRPLLKEQASPVAVLTSRYQNQVPVLILDQADSVSEISGRSAHVRDLLDEMINDGTAYGNLKIVIACRNHDLNNDHRFKALKDNAFTKHVDVGLLDWDRDLMPYLSAIGLDGGKASQPQRQMLQKPINLGLFLACLEGLEADAFKALSSTSSMIKSLIERRQNDLRITGAVWTIFEVLEVICDYFNAHQTLAAPQLLLNKYPGAKAYLQSAGLFSIENGLIQLTHEALFDYVYAQSFVLSNKSVVSELTSKEQFLFRRTQVRQIFSGLRDLPGQYPRYIEELRAVLTSPEIRYHVKDSVAKWFSTVERPSDAESEIAFSLSDAPELSHLTRQIVSGQSWFDRLSTSGVIHNWLTSSCDHRRNFAQFLVRRAIDSCPDDAARMIHTILDHGAIPEVKILHMLVYALPSRKSEELLRAQIRAISQCPAEVFGEGKFPGFADFASWHKIWPEAQAKVLEAWLNRWLEIHSKDDPFSAVFQFNSTHSHWLGELAKKSPEHFCFAILPTLCIAMKRDAALGENQGKGWCQYDRIWPHDRESGIPNVIDFVRNALTEVAKSTPDLASELLEQLPPHLSRAALHLHLETIKANPEALHVRLRSLLENDDVLKAGPDGAEWQSFANAIAETLPWLEPDICELAWQLVRNHNPEYVFLKRSLERNVMSEVGVERIPCSSETRKWMIHNLNEVGLEKWAILKTIGPTYLPRDLRTDFEQLCRKFHGKALPEAHHSMGGMVRSPIDQKAASRMSDRQWLNAMHKYDQGRGEMRSFHKGYVIGGGHELSQELTTQAKADPVRFVNLITTLPDGCLPAYLDGIVSGVMESKADDKLVLRLFRLVAPRLESLFKRGIIWGFQKHRGIIAEPDVLAFLINLAQNGDAHENNDKTERRKEKEKKSLDDIYQGYSGLYGDAINGDRGAAYNTIADGLWENDCLLNDCIDLLKKQIQIESLNAVRMCMLHLVNSIGKYDPAQASAFVRQIAQKSLIPLSGQHGIHFLRWLLPNRFAEGWPIVNAMIESEDETISAAGILILGLSAFNNDEARSHFEQIRRTSALARRISADLAANNIRRVESCELQRQWLLDAMFDDDTVIQEECCSAKWEEILAPDSKHQDLAYRFIESHAIMLSSDHFVHAFEDIADAHSYLGLKLIDRLIQIAPDYNFQGHNGHHSAMHYLGPILNRMYQNAEKDHLAAGVVLDRIDTLLQIGFYGIEDVLKSHERI
jgi:hypothetical protein